MTNVTPPLPEAQAGSFSPSLPDDVIKLVERYLNPRALTFADWKLHGGEMLHPSLVCKRLGIPKSPLPNAVVGLWMPGDGEYGAGVFLSQDEYCEEVFRERRAPASSAAEHDVIRIGWHESEAIYDAESVIKAIVIHKATGLPVLANNGIRGWSNSRFHKARPRGDSTVREYILYDSLPTDTKKRQHQLDAERLRCALSVEQGYIPYVARLPEPPPITGLASWGVDDYAAHYGLEALTKLQAKAIRYLPAPPPAEFTPSEAAFVQLFADTPEMPAFIIDNFMPLEVGVVSATGGMGKTTLVLWMAIHIAIGRDVFGHKVLRPGPVLFVTGEDNRQIFHHRLWHLCKSLDLTDGEKQLVAKNIYVEDVSTRVARLAEADAHGNLSPTDLVDRLVAAYGALALSLVVLDPLISFSPGERFVNDGAQSLIIQARRLCNRLNASVLLVNHVSKEHAQGNEAKQHAGRGGTAIGDGCRFEYELRRVTGSDLKIIPPELLDPGTAHALYVHKLSHGPRPELPYLFVRRGFGMVWVEAADQSQEAQEERRAQEARRQMDADIEKLVAYVRTLDLKSSPETARSLRDSSALMGVPKGRVDAVVDEAVRRRILEVRPLPAGQRKGARKDGLYFVEKKYVGQS